MRAPAVTLLALLLLATPAVAEECVPYGASACRQLVGTVSLTADDQAVSVGGAELLLVTSNSGTATARTFTLADVATAGRVLRLLIVAQAAELADTGTAKLSAAWQPNADDTLSLVSDGTSWVEVGRAAN